MDFNEFIDKYCDTTAEPDFFKTNKLIHGLPKSGKTTFAANLTKDGKQPFFVTTEHGINNKNIKYYFADCWEKIVKVCNLLIINKSQVKDSHSCLVFDLISDMCNMCSVYISANHNAVHPEDIGSFGKGFHLVTYEFRKVFEPILLTFPGTVFISHSVDKTYTVNSKQIVMSAPDMSKGPGQYIQGKCDFIGFIEAPSKIGLKPTITFNSSGRTAIAGSRFKEMNRSFNLEPDNMLGSVEALQQYFKENVK